jgi:hypothetical protein
MKWVMILFLLLFCPLAVRAIGIAPAQSDLVLTPDATETLLFRVYNTEGGPRTVTIEANGTLAPYITLDQTSVTFAASERVKSISATIRAPDKPQDLAADIRIISNTDVSARIAVTMSQPMPTGNVLAGEKKDTNLSTLLIALVAGNVLFFVVAGVRRHQNAKKQMTLKKVKTSEELISLLKTIDAKVFAAHVTSDKNEFADWLEAHGYPELAYRIYDITGREQMIAALEYAPAAPANDSESLKREVQLLKHELDTFDFKEFEKVYK